MSIIYEALNKTQKRLTMPNTFVGKKNSSILTWLLSGFIVLGFIGCGLVIMLLSRNPQTTNRIQSKLIDTKNISKTKIKSNNEKKYYGSFDLSGIISMDNAYFALINSKMVTVGDYIEGAEVVSILSDEVNLNLKGDKIKLKIR